METFLCGVRAEKFILQGFAPDHIPDQSPESAADNFAFRVKTLSDLKPYDYICKSRTSERDRFILNPVLQMLGLNT